MGDANENRSHAALEQGIRRRMEQQTDDMTVQKKIEYYIASAMMSGGEKDEKTELPDDQIYQSVSQKLKNGDALSLTEESQLQHNSMKAYERAKALEQENEKFLQKLRKCETQLEVRNTEAAQLESIISAYRLAENASELPIEQKREYTLTKDAKLSAIHSVAQNFMESDAYKKLPPCAGPALSTESEAPASKLSIAEDAAVENAEALKEWEARRKKAQSSYESLRQSIDEQEALEAQGKVPFDAKG